MDLGYSIWNPFPMTELDNSVTELNESQPDLVQDAGNYCLKFSFETSQINYFNKTKEKRESCYPTRNCENESARMRPARIRAIFW